MMIAFKRCAAVLVLAVLVVGCGESGPPTGTVKGKLTVNGQPYGDAAVVLLGNETGQVGQADLQPDGSFQMAQPLPAGKYTVFLSPKIVDTAEPTPIVIDKSVPEKFWNEGTSGVTVDVAEGENDIPIDLK